DRWSIRFKYPESLGGRRIVIKKSTNDVRIAAEIRDRLLAPFLGENHVAEAGRKLIAAVSKADETGAELLERANRELNVVVPEGPSLSETIKLFVNNRRIFKVRSAFTVDDYQRTLTTFTRVVGNLRLTQIDAKVLR